MRVRELEERDIPVVKQMHAESGFDYTLPEFFKDGKLDQEFPRISVLVDEEDTIVLVLPTKKLIEMFCLINRNWRNPRWRLEALRVAHEDMRRWLQENGWPEVQSWPPPEIEKSFGKRLTRIFHWVPSRWKSYSRRTEAIGNERNRGE